MLIKYFIYTIGLKFSSISYKFEHIVLGYICYINICCINTYGLVCIKFHS